MAQIYNPLLKLGFQKDSNGGGSAEEISLMKQSIAELQRDKIAKINSFGELSNVAIGETIQWQGETDVDFINNFFYQLKPNGDEIPQGTPFLTVSANDEINLIDINLKAGNYYYDSDSITSLSDRGISSLVPFSGELWSEGQYWDLFTNFIFDFLNNKILEIEDIDESHLEDENPYAIYYFTDGTSIKVGGFIDYPVTEYVGVCNDSFTVYPYVFPINDLGSFDDGGLFIVANSDTFDDDMEWFLINFSAAGVLSESIPTYWFYNVDVQKRSENDIVWLTVDTSAEVEVDNYSAFLCNNLLFVGMYFRFTSVGTPYVPIIKFSTPDGADNLRFDIGYMYTCFDINNGTLIPNCIVSEYNYIRSDIAFPVGSYYLSFIVPYHFENP